MTQLSEAQHVAVLQEMLQNSLDLAAVSAYFFDHLGDKPSLFTSSAKTENPHLAHLVAGAVTALTGRPCKLAFPTFMHLAKYDLFHGPIRLPKGFATVFFFDKLDLGMVTLAGDDDSLAYMRLSRQAEA
jgi:hypothetical protein